MSPLLCVVYIRFNLKIINTGRQTVTRLQSATNRTVHNKQNKNIVSDQDKGLEMSKPVTSKTSQ